MDWPLVSEQGFLYFFSTVAQVQVAMIAVVAVVYTFRSQNLGRNLDDSWQSLASAIDRAGRSFPTTGEKTTDLARLREQLSASENQEDSSRLREFEEAAEKLKAEAGAFRKLPLPAFVNIVLATGMTLLSKVASTPFGFLACVLIGLLFAISSIQHLWYFRRITKGEVTYQMD